MAMFSSTENENNQPFEFHQTNNIDKLLLIRLAFFIISLNELPKTKIVSDCEQ